MKLKGNALIRCNECTKKAILFDTYSSKKYYIPYEIGARAENGNLTSEEIEKLNHSLIDSPISIEKASSSLDHLRLLVTNSCNFRCKYCFANHSSYGLRPHHMTKEIAKSAIDFFFHKYDSIHQISFFGGEPLLAIDIIEYACKYLTQICKSSMPLLSLVTNGSLLNDSVVKLLKQYNIAIIVSHDGPEFINDMQRQLPDGEGTFDIVDQNIRRYKNGLNLGIEATYTSNHERNHVLRSDVLEYFKTQYGITRVSVNDADMEDTSLQVLAPSSLGEFEQIVDFFATEGTHITDFVYQLMIQYLTGSYHKTFCDAGLNQFAVDMDGNIYPCHRFVGKPEHILGTVMNSTVSAFNQSTYTKESKHCSNCKYRLFCQACSYALAYSEQICDCMKQCIPYFLNNMIDALLDNRNKYDQLVERCINYGKCHKIENAIGSLEQ